MLALRRVELRSEPGPRNVPFAVHNRSDRSATFVLSFSPPPRVAGLDNPFADAEAKGRRIYEPSEFDDIVGESGFPYADVSPYHQEINDDMTNVLMMASFGLEIVECGGALAKAVRDGDTVHAAVLMSRPESQPQIRRAAEILGITEVEFLGVNNGEVVVTPEAKQPIVELIRRTKPDVIIMQDPEHAQHDLDPDRRMIALLYAESMAVAGRDWRIDECGGHPPHPAPTIYYMTPSNPNCVVEISDTFGVKQQALEVLAFQMSFSAQSIKQRANVEAIRHIVDAFDDIADDDTRLGLALHQQFERANALYHGLAGHSGAVLGEAYRREGAFVLDRLTA